MSDNTAATNEEATQRVEEDFVIPPGGLHLEEQPRERHNGEDERFFATGEQVESGEPWGADKRWGRSDGAAGDGAASGPPAAATAEGGAEVHQDEVTDPVQVPPPYVSRNQDPSLKVDNLSAEDADHH